MSTKAVSLAERAPSSRPGRIAPIGVRGLGAAALAAFALLGGPGAAASAQAAPLCGEREQILERLQQKHHETPQALGLSADGGVLELLVSPGGGWTILVTYPARPTCVVAVGQAWQTLTLVGQPA